MVQHVAVLLGTVQFRLKVKVSMSKLFDGNPREIDHAM